MPQDDPAPSRPAHSRESLAAQAMGTVDPLTRAIVPPIHVATTYLRDPDNAYSSGYVYGRPDNATVREAEAVLAMLEGAADAMLFGSGMAAATTLIQTLSPGDHIVAPRVMYWALRHWLLTEATRWGLAVDLADVENPEALRAAIRPGRTKLVWIETPANPLWTLVDIAQSAAISHEAGAILAVDSTCAGPFHTQPLALGADVVMHAATKILNGHSDVIAGVLVTAQRVLHGRRLQRSARDRARSSARSRPSFSCAGCGPCSCAPRGRRRARRSSPNASPCIRISRGCSIQACRSIRDTTSPHARWRTASATCSRYR